MQINSSFLKTVITLLKVIVPVLINMINDPEITI